MVFGRRPCPYVLQKQGGKTGWDRMGQYGTGIAIFVQFGETSATGEREFGTIWDKMGQQWENSVPWRHRIALRKPDALGWPYSIPVQPRNLSSQWQQTCIDRAIES